MSNYLNVSMFLTDQGVDIVLTDNNNLRTRGKVSYESMETVINGEPIGIRVTDNDNDLIISIGDEDFTATLQPKGHYFAWCQPMQRSTPIDIKAVRERLANLSLQ